MDLLAKANSSTKAKPSIKPKKEEKKPNLLDKALKNEKVKKPTEDVKKSVKKTRNSLLLLLKVLALLLKKRKKEEFLHLLVNMVLEKHLLVVNLLKNGKKHYILILNIKQVRF